MTGRDTALLLASARLLGGAPLRAVAIGAAEQAARAVGRDLALCATRNGTVVTLAWPIASEPAACTSPRLARRGLPSTAVKTFLIAYAELTSPWLAEEPGVLASASRSRLMGLCERLLGKESARAWSAYALRRSLLVPHLLIPAGRGQLALGPAVAGMDPMRRRHLDTAAERLRYFPLWEDPIPGEGTNPPCDLDHPSDARDDR